MAAFVDKAKAYLDTGVKAAQDALTKAGGAVQEMGDKSKLKLELAQLKAARKKEYEALGEAVYRALCVRKDDAVTAGSPELAETIAELNRVSALIAEKTGALNEDD